MSTQAIGNMGTPSGAVRIKRVVKGFLVQTFADDGTRNELDFSSTTSLTKVALDALVANSDPSKRWHPLPKFFNVELPKADPVTFTAGDGTNFFIQPGIRNATINHYEQDPTLLKSLDTLECAGNADWSIFMVTECGKVIVEEVIAGFGRPHKIASSTFNADWQYMSDSDPSAIIVRFDFDKLIKDSRIKTVVVDDDADILNKNGLVTVRMAYTTITTTTGIATATFDYGNLGVNQAYVAAVTADLDLNEITPTPGAVPGFAVTEGLDGVYAMSWTLEASGDILEMTSTQAGLDKGFEIEANSRFTIP